MGIKRLYYADTSKITADLTGAALYALLQDEATKEVKNVHQDTWTIEESESSQDTYKNQLTGTVYRMGTKSMGEVSFNWTIGQYDYHTKADFLGGTATDTTWKRARGIVEVKKVLIALTEDNQYCVLPNANVSGHEANTDKAVGIAVKGIALEPENENVSSEYWFDSSEVVAGS